MNSILEEILKSESQKQGVQHDMINKIVQLNISMDSSESSEKRQRQKAINNVLLSHVSEEDKS
ncbi:hypothetical protein N9Y19_01730 [Porticoccaceae bacterium]|nr:hypothetical protein [Porticoccaceae bacterium]